MRKIILLPALKATVQAVDTDAVSTDRSVVLQPLISYIQKKKDKHEAINLNFICTHNSRRSQLSQIWAQTAAYYYGIDAQCYSGGVEVTAFNERAVEAIKRAGFRITQKGETNPTYFVWMANGDDPIPAFSKLFDDPINASSSFAAVMTCSHADENCPFIPGTEARIPVRYDDPKAFDNTPQEAEKYDERSEQIATEMFYVFSRIS